MSWAAVLNRREEPTMEMVEMLPNYTQCHFALWNKKYINHYWVPFGIKLQCSGWIIEIILKYALLLWMDCGWMDGVLDFYFFSRVFTVTPAFTAGIYGRRKLFHWQCWSYQCALPHSLRSMILQLMKVYEHMMNIDITEAIFFLWIWFNWSAGQWYKLLHKRVRFWYVGSISNGGGRLSTYGCLSLLPRYILKCQLSSSVCIFHRYQCGKIVHV